jgi:hypothetical protein
MNLKKDFEEFVKMLDIQLSLEQAEVIAEAAIKEGKLVLRFPSSVKGFYEVYVYEDFIVQMHSDGDIVAVIKSNKIIYMGDLARYGKGLVEKYLREVEK